MSDLISRAEKERILALLDEQIDWWSEFDDGETESSLMTALINAKQFINDAPTINAVEQKHGHWIEELASQHGNTYDGRTWTKYKKYRCSYCGITNGNRRPDYCPHCGSKMDEEVKRNDH